MKIDDNIPIPPLAKHTLSPTRVLFNQLQPGQSIFVPTANPDSLRGTAAKWALITHFTITTRRVTEDGVLGLRIWRVS